LRLGDGRLERLGDEAGDGAGVRAVVRRGHRDDGILGLRILADGQLGDGAQAEHEDQQAHDRRQHRSLDEKVSELHCRKPHSSCGAGLGSFLGCTRLSGEMGVPFFSLSCPLVTTMSPCLMPLTTATWSPRVGPTVTKVCCATSKPAAPGAFWAMNTVAPYGLYVIEVCGSVR